ncbi:MAG: hypothetical protein ACTSQC_06810 [Candidatus Heimdallarchaeaceae archaeon]
MNGKDVKKIQKIVITLFLVSVITISPSYSTVSGKSTNILVILGPSFGNSYFINNDIMEEYGWNVDVAGTASNLISCYNKPLQNINTDHIISEVDDKWRTLGSVNKSPPCSKPNIKCLFKRSSSRRYLHWS